MIFLDATLAAPINKLFSALAGAATLVWAKAEPFKASGAAAAFWSFSAAGKGLGLRGYERVIYPIIWKCYLKTNKEEINMLSRFKMKIA